MNPSKKTWAVRLNPFRLIRRFLPDIAGSAPKFCGVPGDTDSIWPCWVKGLAPLLKDNGESGWKISDIFRGSTAWLKEFKSHMSLLGPANMPHPPHEHKEEELIIMLSGEMDIITLKNTRCIDSYFLWLYRRHLLINGF